ncbi:MAG: nucleotidyltransferase domain-containing protein [Alphaproteobacteria bacterium]|nr:nucleotidyltransferase domain-containing protein [Alphaproteobacteria bacterium]
MGADIHSYEFIMRLKSLPCVESLYLFGSRARTDHRERSDIDIAVKLRANTAEDWRKVMDIIETADTLLEIDCVNLDEAEEALRQKIETQGTSL